MTADQVRIEALENEVTRLLKIQADAVTALGEKAFALRNKTEEAALILSRAEVLERELASVRENCEFAEQAHFKAVSGYEELAQKHRAELAKNRDLAKKFAGLWEDHLILQNKFDGTLGARVRKFWREKILGEKKPRCSRYVGDGK